ncbi:C/D box methylation guide ribonucleoprotein complex aNOP56 subunit [Desulfurococcaceae archaeon MEX13E-LK6-19]|nr:C/D box methylation guide ribonucleoprotein complex aNOP56 subunit [Desulfurococcaceae archaeon MEX13E-LK6-19]
MKAYLVDTVIGVFALDDEGKVVAYSLAPKDLDENVEYLLKIESGEETPQLKETLEKLKEANVKTVIVETETDAKYASAAGFEVEIKPGNEMALLVRDKLMNYALEYEFVKSEEEYHEFLHTALLELTRRKLRRAAEKRDMLAVQAIRAIDDIDKTINLFVARLREWYSLHFPELDDLIREHPDYVKVVAELGHRDNITKENLVKLGFSEAKAEKIAEAAKKSIGADLSDFDIIKIQTLARIIDQLYKLRSELADYIEAVMKEVAPNITALVGPLLGARLLSLAGGLESLARLPASTIQVLGAEKALFRALRTGGKPPKHGVIFQFPAIHRSPRWQRGKIARALAAKLAIAAKIDFFTGRFIGDKLREELDKRIEEIKKLYAKPPARKREERPRERPRPRGKRRGRGKKGRRK